MPVEDSLPPSIQEPTDLEVQKQREAYQYNYAMTALQAMEKDRQAEREHNYASQKTVRQNESIITQAKKMPSSSLLARA